MALTETDGIFKIAAQSGWLYRSSHTVRAFYRSWIVCFCIPAYQLSPFKVLHKTFDICYYKYSIKSISCKGDEPMKKGDSGYYTNRHSCFLLQYHLVLVTKFQTPVIRGEIKDFMEQYMTAYFKDRDLPAAGDQFHAGSRPHPVWCPATTQSCWFCQCVKVRVFKDGKKSLSGGIKTLLLETILLESQLFYRMCKWTFGRSCKAIHSKSGKEEK